MIRLATPADAASLADLFERTFRSTFAEATSSEDMDEHCRNSYSAAIQGAEIRDPGRVTLVCESEGNLVGCGQLRRGTPPACVQASAPVEIQRLYVDARWHGKGIAQGLMDALLEAAARLGADEVWLGVWERNPRAIAFYAKNGFAMVGEHVFVVGSDPQRDLILARRII